jgi:hypothetical protein
MENINSKCNKYPIGEEYMSEELKQKGLIKNGLQIGNYEYYNIGNTNLNQLKKYKIVPDKDYIYMEYGDQIPF